MPLVGAGTLMPMDAALLQVRLLPLPPGSMPPAIQYDHARRTVVKALAHNLQSGPVAAEFAVGIEGRVVAHDVLVRAIQPGVVELVAELERGATSTDRGTSARCG